jgi:signal transduction histidine kinase
MHGADLEDVIGRPFMDFVAPDCRDRVLKTYHEALACKPMVGQLEYTRYGCAPEEAATEIRSKVIDLGQGPVMIGICRDISARVAMEAKVRDHERMAYVGHLTASLSHEIRNPLSSIKMNLQILSRKLELNGFDQRRLEITVQQVSRLEGTLRQLLDIARPLEIITAPVDLAALARGCVDLLEPKCSEKQLEVVQLHSRRLPLGILDAGKIEQAVINLMLNAIDAAPEDGKITVWTKWRRNEQNRVLELGVRDNGPGIAREHMKHLFTPFYTSKARGTGLGLSNVKRIVEAHSGSVEVRSRKGRGATFLMRLPCVT